jgi:hypothetical protein
MLNGLTGLSTKELKRLLSHVYKKELECPVNVKRVAQVGFQYKQENITSALRGLDSNAVRCLLVCVLAERRKQEGAAFYSSSPK